jgi:hypothetical protein
VECETGNKSRPAIGRFVSWFRPDVSQTVHERAGMMILVFIGIGIIIAMAVMGALESLDKVQTAGGIVDLNAISNMAAASSQQNSPYYQLILLLIGCCWILSVVDAYRLGKRKSPTDAQGNVNRE